MAVRLSSHEYISPGVTDGTSGTSGFSPVGPSEEEQEMNKVINEENRNTLNWIIFFIIKNDNNICIRKNMRVCLFDTTSYWIIYITYIPKNGIL